MPTKNTNKSPPIFIIAGFCFTYWFASCLLGHTTNMESTALDHDHALNTVSPSAIAGACCLLADIAGIVGLILLAMKRRWAQAAFLTALLAGLSHQFYLFNFDPDFMIYHLVDVAKPVVGIFITLILIWYAHIATENRWVT